MPSLLDPALLARIGDLELAARTVVDGLRSGPHRSPFHGYSAEFSQYRHYRAGDDLKYIDWKLLARTDRLYTKQFRETTDLAATIVIDTSGSMSFASEAAEASQAGEQHASSVSKLQYATMAAAALAYVISTQGDAVGLLATQEGPEGQDKTSATLATASAGRAITYVAPRSGTSHLRGVIAAMTRLSASGAAAPDAGVRRATDLLRRRGLLLVFSDFYDRESETIGELRRAARMGHDVMVFQVVTRAELEFPFRDDVDFRDLESSRSVLTNARDIRTAYKDAFAAFVERWRTQTRAEGLDYTLLVTDTPLDEALRGVLLRRTAA
jgi:uncharacterized protein (DUF58 family)